MKTIYPFGSAISDMQYVNDTNRNYRYGFNGKEEDAEGMGGGGSTYDYGFRIYNPSIGKFLSVDPLTCAYPWYTPYQFAGNMPIWAIDVDGLEEKKATKKATIIVIISRSDGSMEPFQWYVNGKMTTITPGRTVVQQGEEGGDIETTYQYYRGTQAGSAQPGTAWDVVTTRDIQLGKASNPPSTEPIPETNLVQTNETEGSSNTNLVGGSNGTSTQLEVPTANQTTATTATNTTTTVSTSTSNSTPSPVKKLNKPIPFNGKILKAGSFINLSDQSIGWFSISKITGGIDPFTNKTPVAGNLCANGRKALRQLANSINSMSNAPTSINLNINAIIGNACSDSETAFASATLSKIGANAAAYLKSLLKNSNINVNVTTLVSKSNTSTTTTTATIR